MDIGVVTLYTATVGAPLFCGGTFTAAAAWLALPVEQYLDGTALCGDTIIVVTEDGAMALPARDAGPFGANCVRDGPVCHPILADIPAHAFPWKGISHRVNVYNLSAIARGMGVRREQ